MSTPNPIVFTPLTKEFSWVPANTDTNDNPLPAGEVQVGATIGIRADGDTAFSYGNYKWFVPVSGNATSESVTALMANNKLPPGNYWAAVDQTDQLPGGSPITSGWSKEIAFSIPAPPPVTVQPMAPSNFSAS